MSVCFVCLCIYVNSHCGVDLTSYIESLLMRVFPRSLFLFFIWNDMNRGSVNAKAICVYVDRHLFVNLLHHVCVCVCVITVPSYMFRQ